MTASIRATRSQWHLRHQWHGKGDLAALALCRAYLDSMGIDFVDAGESDAPAASKMHGMEMVDALAVDQRSLYDLTRAARDAQWDDVLPPFVRRYMVHGGRWHGIPMGIHRSNVAWVNAGIAAAVGLPQPTELASWVRWLDEARRITLAPPLAMGRDAWQVGLLFESVVLAVAGVRMYRRAFEELDASAWNEPTMVDAIDCLMSLREFVDDAHLDLRWSEQLARVERGDAGMQVMGDWVRAMAVDRLLEWETPGTAGKFIAIVDFFVPLAGAAPLVTNHVAAALTDVHFQQRFAAEKGCMPASRLAWEQVSGARGRLLERSSRVVPSLTFDQCCPIASKETITSCVAHHFLERLGTSACASALTHAA